MTVGESEKREPDQEEENHQKWDDPSKVEDETRRKQANTRDTARGTEKKGCGCRPHKLQTPRCEANPKASRPQGTLQDADRNAPSSRLKRPNLEKREDSDLGSW